MYCPQITLKFAFGSLGSYVLSICMMLSWIFCQSWFYFDWRSNRHLHCRCCLFGAFRYRNLIRSMTSFGFFQSFVMFFFLPFCFSQPWWPMSNIACQQRAFQPFRQTTFTWGSHATLRFGCWIGSRTANRTHWGGIWLATAKFAKFQKSFGPGLVAVFVDPSLFGTPVASYAICALETFANLSRKFVAAPCGRWSR